MRTPTTTYLTKATNAWIKKTKKAKGLNSDTSVILMIMTHALNGLKNQDTVSMDIKKFHDERWPIAPRPAKICFRLGRPEVKVSKKQANDFRLPQSVFYALVLEWAADRKISSFE